MFLSSTNPGSSSQPPTDGPNAPSSDGGFEDQADAAVWKRRYLALRDAANAPTSSRKKSR
jgi:hypothetical protein